VTHSRILVVEDDVLVRRAYERVLIPEHTVTAVGTGNDALIELGRERFDAIVSDIDVPGISGIELLKAVRRSDMHIPVVFVTGCPTVRTAQDAVNFGAIGYLTKPVAPEELKQAVARATRSRTTPQPRVSVEPVATDDLEARFDRAIAGLYMAFQPIVSMRERRVVGYEALLRTEERSLVRPPDLLEAAERLNRLDLLGRTVRQKVADAIPLAPPDARIFVNLHPRDLADEALFSDDCPLLPFVDRMVLEITERASLDGVDDVHTRVMRLRERGYWLAIDDLGAGYAGLTSVTRLEPEVVKLDMSLVRGVDRNRTQQQFIASISHVCRELGMTVVTEGVETPAERDTLLGLGCDVLQGYLFGRPSRVFEAPAL
jgi:EAL domain-containing protein (putative c-di-GMP-specific phosphodiesterase class I)